jgi:hypothetical protein
MTWIDTFSKLPDAVKVAFAGAVATIIVGIIGFFNKVIERLIGREGKRSDDQTKLRSDLMERLKHLEGRIDQMTATNMALNGQNAEFKVRLEMQDQQRSIMEARLLEATQKILLLEEEIKRKDQIHSEEREFWVGRIKELEDEVSNLRTGQTGR